MPNQSRVYSSRPRRTASGQNQKRVSGSCHGFGLARNPSQGMESDVPSHETRAWIALNFKIGTPLLHLARVLAAIRRPFNFEVRAMLATQSCAQKCRGRSNDRMQREEVSRGAKNSLRRMFTGVSSNRTLSFQGPISLQPG